MTGTKFLFSIDSMSDDPGTSANYTIESITETVTSIITAFFKSSICEQASDHDIEPGICD
jgi:hypothetical protein